MQTMRILAISVSLGAVWMLALPASAEVYKWTDASGVVHYGQLPPASEQAEAVGGTATSETEPAAESPVAAQPTPAVDEDEVERVRAEQAERDAKRKAEWEEYCVKARAALKELDENPSSRLAQVSDSGERVRMTQEEHDAQRAQIQAAIDKHCN